MREMPALALPGSKPARRRMSPQGLVVAALALLVTSGQCQRDCDFSDRSCGWQWSSEWKLLSAQNLTASGLGTTAPAADAQNNVKGLFLYWSTNGSNRQVHLKIESPLLAANTLPTCALQMSVHMYQMDPALFQVIIEAPNSTWESTRFIGDSAHTWEKQEESIGVLSQPFKVVLEIHNDVPVSPSHIAVDDIRIVRCYIEDRNGTGDCNLQEQFECKDKMCLESSDVCDAFPHCVQGEDEEYECDQLPVSAICNFENGMCGWNNNETENSKWVLHRGETPNVHTGPSVDHTYQNESGTYLMAKFPSGRAFGKQTSFTSPWFTAPPYYHRNIHSAYYNTCQVRFYYHKYGHSIGELRVYTLESDPPSPKPKATEIWRSYGNKGDLWWKAAVTLPNMTNKYQIQFTASRGMGHSDIAIDDLTLSKECFGIGVPINETIQPTTGPGKEVKIPEIKKYVFGPCGARGRFGPNETMCSMAYRNTSTQVGVMSEPTMEGVQKWIVPETGLYTVFVMGAGGGNGVIWRDGEESLGTSLRATFEWNKGHAIYMLVGQRGTSACGDQPRCAAGIQKRSIERIRAWNKVWDNGAGGGGGGATYLFTLNPVTLQRHPIAIAGGGGGLSARVSPDDNFINVSPHGQNQNASILPINGYTSTGGAGGGGGWDDSTSVPTSGMSLKEGGKGGEVCPSARIWETHGGFGGGGGGCLSGGGGGGYRGGDAAGGESESPFLNGQGGTSYLHAGAIRTLVQPGVNQGDGSVIVLPAQPGCGCQYQCVYLDLQFTNYYCICPPSLTINIDGYTCNGYTENISPKTVAVIILGVIFLMSAAGVAIFYAKYRYTKVHHPDRDVSDEPLTSPEEQLNRLRSSGGMISENNPNYEFGGNTCTEQDLKKVPRENLRLVKALGQGAFGEVYEGYLKNPEDNSEMPVAVKTLPELSSSQAILDFLMEALIMSKFNHPNIVSFIGVCFEKLPRFIVLELLPGGDLKSFLRECRPKPNKPSTLTVTDLLMLAMDVAKGCQYLEENHFIHRDIAARNCLLTTKDANRVVKIADFGMARDIYRADYYRKGGKAMLPVKWMPPEAFLDGIFTSKTDVWSFGILLWEVMSLGYMPYPGRCNQEVMQLITSGGRLEPPTNCPGPVYHIMMQCWHPHPEQRPNFSTIIERIGYCLQDPDVINAPLPIFNRAPSMERDATVMRPIDDDSRGCLQVQRPDLGLLLSPGSEDYLIPNQQSSYSLTTELQSSPSQGSADQLLELEDRSKSPSTQPGVWETNFMTRDNLPEHKNRSHPPMTRQDGYTEVPTEDADSHAVNLEETKLQQNGYVATGEVAHKSAARIKSLDDLPIAPKAEENENNLKNTETASSKHRSNLSLDPRALVRQMNGSEPTNLPPNRYMNVDVNCNAGDSNPSIARTGLSNRNSITGPFDGYSGVNPVV